MAPEDIAKHLARDPFEALCIHLANGSSYDVFERWHAGLARTEMFIGIDMNANGIPRRSILCDPREVTQIEPLPNGPGSRGNGQ